MSLGAFWCSFLHAENMDSHWKPCDTDFTVQSRKKLAKQCKNYPKIHDQTSGRSRHHLPPPWIGHRFRYAFQVNSEQHLFEFIVREHSSALIWYNNFVHHAFVCLSVTFQYCILKRLSKLAYQSSSFSIWWLGHSCFSQYWTNVVAKFRRGPSLQEHWIKWWGIQIL